MCCVIIGTIPLPSGFVDSDSPRATALGHCLRQQNPRAGGLFLKQIHEDLKVFVQKQLDFFQVNLLDILTVFDALKHCFNDTSDEKLMLNATQEVLSRFENTRVLFLRPNQLTMWKSMQHTLLNLSYILLVDGNFIHNDISDESQLWNLGDCSVESDSALNVVFQNQPMEHGRQLLHLLNWSERPFVVRFNHCHSSEPMIDLAVLAEPNVRQLHLHHSNMSFEFNLFVDSEVIKCEHLTHLTCNDVIIEDVVLACLSRSVQNGHLPNLKYLSLAGSKESVSGNMGVLFKTLLRYGSE